MEIHHDKSSEINIATNVLQGSTSTYYTIMYDIPNASRLFERVIYADEHL